MIASARVSFGVMFLAPAKCQGGDLNRCSKLHRCSITLSAVASNVDGTVRPAAIEIRGNPNLAMPEPFENDFRMHVRNQHASRVGLPQIMERKNTPSMTGQGHVQGSALQSAPLTTCWAPGK